MQKIEFLVQGSNVEPYLVTVIKRQNNVIVTCECEAANNLSFCKHRVRILKGLKDDIISKNLNELTTVKGWITGSELETIINKVDSVEKEIYILNSSLKKLKKELSKALVKAS